MTDRELLALAAKAAGYVHQVSPIDPEPYRPQYWIGWNPLENDADTLRLAVRLKLSIHLRPKRVEVLSWLSPVTLIIHGIDEISIPKVKSVEPYGNDPGAAVRRAVVRAAAEVEKARAALNEVHQALQDESEEPKPCA